MLVAVGQVQMEPLLNGIIAMAKDETQQHELNREQGRGTWQHDDGWGISFLDNDQQWVVHKSTLPIFEDPDVEQFRDIITNAVVLHVRKKIGSEKDLKNTHPFTVDSPEPVVFCHNGYVEEEIQYAEKFQAKGETDSEKLFYSILTDMHGSNAVGAVRKNFKRYRKLKGTNIILASKNHTVVAVRRNQFPEYYQMQIGQTEEQVIISSEALITLPRLAWAPVAQGEILRITNNTQEIETFRERRRFGEYVKILKETYKESKYLSFPRNFLQTAEKQIKAM
jgi:predicted glutamine amidotransferase